MVLALVSIMTLGLIGFNLLYADNKEEAIKKHAPDYYKEEYQAFIKNNVKQINEMNQKGIFPLSTSQKRLSVPLRQQINEYYCGPASLQMVLLYKEKSYSQNRLGEISGTTSSDGTYVYRMTDTLNDILGNKYVYVHLDDQSFLSGATYSLERGYPVICHVKANELDRYSDAEALYYHYVVVTGYYAGYNGSNFWGKVYYNDPNYVDKYYGKYMDTLDNMTAAIASNAGFFIRYR